MILVAAAAFSAAGIWWRMSRPAHRRRWNEEGAPRLVGFGGSGDEAATDSFVFAPSPGATIRDDRPPRAISLARLALAIAAWTILLVGAAWAVGFLLKLQLDRYFLSGA